MLNWEKNIYLVMYFFFLSPQRLMLHVTGKLQTHKDSVLSSFSSDF